MLKGAFLGVGIALALLLPPIIHFVSGPVGPLIGGFIGGARTCHGDTGKAALLGLLMGLITIVLTAIPVLFIIMFSSVIPGNTTALAFLIPLGFGLYMGILGTLGGIMGSRSTRVSNTRNPG